VSGARLLALVRALPRHAVSRALGVVGRAPVPRAILRPALAAYARAFGANLAEAERPLGAYATFLDFFTRRLEPGARPLPDDPRVVVSPSDGRVHAAGVVERGLVLQAKGRCLPLADLLDDLEAPDLFAGGTFAVFHLAPGDYHRFHWPFDAVADRLAHLPGDLWPVHAGATARVAGLLARNERAVVSGRLRTGGRFALAAIGALNVGSIRFAFHPLRTNRPAPAAPRRFALRGVVGRRGEEMGWFEFGSALVLVLAADAGRLDLLEPGARVRVGAPIGRAR
jgi:phosphatidylserine decarboxylase